MSGLFWTMQEPLRINLIPSNQLTYFLWLLHLLVQLSLMQLPLSIMALSLVVLLVFSSATYYQYNYVGCSRCCQPEALVLRGDHCQVIIKNQATYLAELKQRHFVANRWVILNLSVPGRRWSQYVLICRDATDVDAFRQLKVRLRYPL